MAKSEKTRKRKSGGKGLVFFGLLAGGVIGAALAMIYSPSNGEENREHLVAYISEKTGM